MGSADPHDRAKGADLPSPFFSWVWQRTAYRVVPSERRSELLDGLAGRGLEIGIGTGASLGYYPQVVSSLDAVEPEPGLRAVATRAAAAAPFPVHVGAGTAEATGMDEDAYDFVVCSLVLCSVQSQAAALAEIGRVLRPGGELRFYEHVAAPSSITRGAQRALDASGLWPCLAGGCHLARDTMGSIREAGFTIERVRRFTSGPESVGVPFLLGFARSG